MSEKKKRLLIIVNTSRFFLSHRLLLAQGARDRGYDVTVASPSDAEAIKITELGFRHYALNMGRKSMNPAGEIATVLKFIWALICLRPDVVHLFTIKPVLYGTLAARLVGIKRIVVTITGLGFLFLNEGSTGDRLRTFVGWFYKLVVRSKKVKVIFQNRDDYQLFLERNWVYKEQSQIILGTGVDMKRFHTDTSKDISDEVIIRPIEGIDSHIEGELQVKPVVPDKPKPIKILFPARFLKDKGLIELVEACQILSKMGLNFVLQLCGSIDPGNPSSISEKELAEIEALPFVKNLGYSSDMPKIFRQADIVCLPSYREGIPLSLLEASACGRPIVTTDVPGCREVVEHGKNGFLSALKNATQLARHLATLALDKKTRTHMGTYGRERAEKLFSSDVVIKQNLACYE